MARVLASLDLEEEEVEEVEGVEGSRKNYSISIMDYETGINHKVQVNTSAESIKTQGLTS